jgi:alcohol dehydrogenase (cytochrome c)
MQREKGFGTVLCSAALGLGLLLATASASAQDPAPGTEDPNNWPQYHRTANGWRYSPLDQISKRNIGHLHVAWIYHAGNIAGGMRETPIAADGVIYSATGGNRVAAIDAKTGKEIWHYETRLDPVTSKFPGPPFSRGVTVGRGKVFIGAFDGRVIALDQRAGKEAWSVQVTDFNKDCAGCVVLSPPILAADTLVVGSGGSETASAGKIYGVNADNGGVR